MKRRKFIKSIGLVGAAAYINPLSLIKLKQPYKVGDVLQIQNETDQYHEGILGRYFMNYDPSTDRSVKKDYQGLKWLEGLDSGCDEYDLGQYQVMDLDKLRKEIIYYANNELPGILENFDKLEAQYPEEGYKHHFEYEYLELCTLCTIIDDKKLWEDIYKSGPYSSQFNTTWAEQQQHLCNSKLIARNCMFSGEILYEAEVPYSVYPSIQKLTNARIGTREYGKYLHYQVAT